MIVRPRPGSDDHIVRIDGDEQSAAEHLLAWGWTDGLPIVVPTVARVEQMCAGAIHGPGEVLGNIAPRGAPLTLQHLAANAVMAGCLPEYMPVLEAAVAAMQEGMFNLFGMQTTTHPCALLVIVHGEIADRIGMNSGAGCFGPGNRANATIGRALNLIVRNVGGGRPGEADRATLGAPSKYTLCFAEDESDPDWEPLSVARGCAPGASAVTLFQGHGPEAFVDQKTRTAEGLACSFGLSLVKIGHPRLVQSARAVVVLSPEHYAIFREAGWDRRRIERALYEATIRPGAELVSGLDGVGEGVPAARAGETVPKFHDDGIMVVRAGGRAGLFSAILPGWLAGRNRAELQPVTKEVRE